jgi:hypothetical protein
MPGRVVRQMEEGFEGLNSEIQLDKMDNCGYNLQQKAQQCVYIIERRKPETQTGGHDE